MVDRTASLTVKLDVPSKRRWSEGLLVEVRDAKKFVRVARGASDGRFEVPAGTYFVTAILPNGQQVAAENIVEVVPGENKVVPLSLTDAEIPASLESKATWSDSVKAFAHPVTQYFNRYNSCIIKGNWLEARLEPGVARRLVRETTARGDIEVKFSPVPTWVEIVGGEGNTHFAVPVDDGGTTTVRWAIDGETGKLNLDFDFSDSRLNSFFDFIQSDQASEAQSISHSINEQATEALLDRRLSPMRATLGAYVLVRFEQRDDMDGWSAKLVEHYPWLPDALALRIEYLARNGKHAQAARLLLDVPKRGTPWIRSGIGYIEKRARVYAKLGGSRSSLELDPMQQEKIQQIAVTFSELAGALDMSQYTTVLRGMPRIG